MSSLSLSEFINQQFNSVFGSSQSLKPDARDELIRLFTPFYNPLTPNNTSLITLFKTISENVKQGNKTIKMRDIYIGLDQNKIIYSYLANNFRPYPFLYDVKPMREDDVNFDKYKARGKGLTKVSVKGGFKQHFKDLIFEEGSMQIVMNCLEYISQVLALGDNAYFDSFIATMPVDVNPE